MRYAIGIALLGILFGFPTTSVLVTSITVGVISVLGRWAYRRYQANAASVRAFNKPFEHDD